MEILLPIFFFFLIFSLCSLAALSLALAWDALTAPRSASVFPSAASSSFTT